MQKGKMNNMGVLSGYIITKDEQGTQVTRKLVFSHMSRLGYEEQLLLAFNPDDMTLLSAFKTETTAQYYKENCWNNHEAQLYFGVLNQSLNAVNKCKLLKNGQAPKRSKIQVYSSVSAQGIVLNYTGKVKAYEFAVSKQQQTSQFITVDITGDDATRIVLQMMTDAKMLNDLNALIVQIPFVEVTNHDKTRIADIETSENEEEELMRRHVRTIDEISLSKDTTWLKNKQYYVITDEKLAEQIFEALEAYNGVISYDVESSGLNINRFCEIGSPFKKKLEEWNAERPKDQRIKADSLTGFSFCIQPNIAYYFPCQHRKFKNLYEDKTEETTRRTLDRIKSRYVIGDLRNDDSYIATYIRETPQEEWSCDVVLMERVRDILEKHRILAHHGSFEWKVGWCYHIDTNIVEDTMIIHQLAFKWKNVRTHAGEPSNLKYLTKSLLGIDQLSLEDFFADFKEAETASEVRSVSMTARKKKKKKKSLIDFSYMDYEGTRCYAPADVDFTLQIWSKLKIEMNRLFPDLDYLYGVEILLACAVGYAEFYGLHINEDKIDAAKYGSLVKMAKMEHKIREYNDLCSDEENKAYDELIALDVETTERAILDEKLENLSKIIDNIGNLKLSSPGQVGELLYIKYGWKVDEDGKKSMGKRVIKQYEKLTDEDGSPLYPEVLWYRDWKDESTLITKFFDKLQDFMYPGGYLFTSFGQIACATGRMSSKKPNFQQMPGSITKIIEPSKGFVFFDGDFSQIEYRVLCAMAGEKSLIDAFSDPDMDYHQKMAALMFAVPYALVADSMRKQAKAFNFGIPYGMGFASLSIQLFGNKNKASIEATKLKYEDYFKDQPKVRQFFMDVKERAQYNEYTRTHFGRRRYFKFTDDTGNINQSFLASALRQAGNAVIQGTARDIYGIAVARVFQALRNNNLLGKIRMNNFIHDEVLYEIDASINVHAAVGLIIEMMQVEIPGFPKFIIGGGIGDSWKNAKGSMNEIHPVLGSRIETEYKQRLAPTELDGTVESVYNYFNNRVYDFRVEKVATYIAQVEYDLRIGKALEAVDPAVGKLLNLQFKSNCADLVEERKKAYKTTCVNKGIEPDKDQLSKIDMLLVPFRLMQFISDFPEQVKDALVKLGFAFDADSNLNNLMIFEALANAYSINISEDEEDVAYSEDDPAEDDFFDYEFELIDENSELYGVSVIDIAKQFGMAIIPSRGVCCIYIGNKTQKQIQTLAELFDAHQCDEEDEGAMKVELVRGDNYVLRPDVWVSGLTSDDVMERMAS